MSVAAQTLNGQCGGTSWTGATSCVDGAVCSTYNPYYAQCVTGAAAAATGTGAAGTKTGSVVVSVTPTVTATTSEPEETDSDCPAEPEETSTAVATEIDDGCDAEPEETEAVRVTMTGSAPAAVTTSSMSASAVPTTMKTSTKAASTTSSAASSMSSSSGQTKFAGVNIAGFDFGCGTDGTCVLSSVSGPITSSSNGTAQMAHFSTDDNLNIFRLPVGWQYLVGDTLGGDLDATAISSYDSLLQSCLALGAYCMIDIHNYARWNGNIIGQSSAVSDDDFVSLWTQLATKYADQERVWFGTMNEPHDVDIDPWAATVQKVVTAIRGAGATSQYISLPGNGYTAASTFISDGSAAALANITNPDGTTDGLIFEVHKYLDSDNSGTNAECVTNNIDDAFSPLATYLRSNGRMAILAETGGGNVDSCEKYLCEEVAYLNENADVYLGYLGWSAGAFATSYVLSMTPTGDVDTALVTACLAR